VSRISGTRKRLHVCPRLTHRNARVIAGPARHEDEPPPSSDNRQVCLETAEHDHPGVEVDTPSHRIHHGFRLFVDFFLHKMVVLSLHDFGKLNLEMLNGADAGEAIIPAKAVDVKL
jgi:hypothetical protein